MNSYTMPLDASQPSAESSVLSRTLTIVIPALNEEQAIGGTIERCLAAARELVQPGLLADVEIIVVSDGSTDRTAEIAQSFGGVQTIVFPKNRGYGAAIAEGFRLGRGELVGFLDADGTCDPAFFGPLCRAVLDGADIALGSRLGPESKMPLTRRVGNALFAVLLGFLCGRRVTDTASGMRVLRRTAWEALAPLPTGLHFTPAMSARALLSDMRVSEIPMRYEERIGQSKLSVVGDGVRFLRTIVSGVLIYRPERLFLIGCTLCLILTAVLGLNPTEHYLRNRRVEEWMIYRFMAGFLLGSAGFLLVCAAALSNRMAQFGPRGQAGETFWSAAVSRLFEGRALAAFVATVLAASTAILWPGIVEYGATATITLHWSRLVVGAFGLLLAFQAVVTGVLMRALSLWQDRRKRVDSRTFRHGSR